MLKKSSTLILKIVLLLIGLAIAGLCLFLLPAGIMSDKTGFYRPLLVYMYLPAFPFFYGLYQAFRLLELIDKNRAFSENAVKSLKKIKYSAFSISALYLLGLPYIYYVAELDDAPGVILIGLVIVGSSFIVGVFATVLQKLMQSALNLKEENDLTV